MTFKLGSLGLRQLETAGTTRWAQDELDKLAAQTRELVRLAVASGDTLRWVAKAQGSASALTSTASRGPRSCCTRPPAARPGCRRCRTTKWPASSPHRGLDAQTAHTETEPAQIRQDLEAARANGYALVEEEMEVGVSAIAARSCRRDRRRPSGRDRQHRRTGRSPGRTTAWSAWPRRSRPWPASSPPSGTPTST